MAERQWYYTSDSQQQGPVAESELKRLIAAGQVTANTYVWSDGMSDWRHAGDIPGLITMAPPPAFAPLPGGTLPGAASAYAKDGYFASTFGTWALFGRGLLYILGILVVVPAPWAATAFYRWIVPHIQIPGWPNLSFTGKVGDIWWVFVGLGLCIYLNQYIQTQQPNYFFAIFLVDILEWVLAWVTLRWIVANVAVNGQQLPLRFEGGLLPYIGWQIFTAVAFISIIGWAWVITATMRWICRNIKGTDREIIFTGTGWEMLWRTIVFGITAIFLIPIPWMLAWFIRWYISQFAVQPRTA